MDVLDAYQELLNSNVNEVKARRDYYVAAMQLLLSMGKLTAEDLRLNVDLYNPKSSIRKPGINGCHYPLINRKKFDNLTDSLLQII